ncbi:winged helix-turn-helix transcriptional regulator [Planctomycetota bacterium]|nr:winged helix-turn-helix transcriptional regulator [Planctomycetota bacterium]
MNDFIKITKSLSDETRVRALMSLTEGELCLCQIIEILKLAPSTISKHMNLLFDAGLIEKRKQGKWQYYRIHTQPQPHIKQILDWTLSNLQDKPTIKSDLQKRCCVMDMDLEDLSACYKKQNQN